MLKGGNKSIGLNGSHLFEDSQLICASGCVTAIAENKPFEKFLASKIAWGLAWCATRYQESPGYVSEKAKQLERLAIMLFHQYATSPEGTACSGLLLSVLKPNSKFREFFLSLQDARLSAPITQL